MNTGLAHALVVAESYSLAAMVKPGLSFFFLALGLVAGGCTTLYEGRYDYYVGWHKAQITRVVPFEKLSPYAYKYCGQNISDFSATGTNWAVIRYGRYNRKRYFHMSVPAQKLGNFKVGDIVYINVRDCSLELQKREAAGK